LGKSRINEDAKLKRRKKAPGQRMVDSALHASIQRALAANDIPGAALLAEQALARGPADPLLLNLAAWRREEAGD
jgi:hypothetical protein